MPQPSALTMIAPIWLVASAILSNLYQQTPASAQPVTNDAQPHTTGPLSPSPPALPPAPPSARMTLPRRFKRGYLSRLVPPGAAQESLHAWNCHSHPHLTKVYSFGRRRFDICTEDVTKTTKLTTSRQSFSVYQYKRIIDRPVLGCSAKISRTEVRSHLMN